MSTQREESLLGYMILWGGVRVAPVSMALAKLVRTDFEDPDCRIIFDALMVAHDSDEPIDALTVSEAINETGNWIARLHELSRDQFVTPETLDAYVTSVRKTGQLRKAQGIAHELLETGDIPEAMAQLMDLNSEARNTKHACTSAELMSATIDHISKMEHGEIKAISTGLTALDAQIGGWHPGDLVVVGGRAKMGKTAWMMNQIGQLQVPFGCMSLEMTREQLGKRNISVVERLPSTIMRNVDGPLSPECWQRISNGAGKISATEGHFNFAGAATLSEVMAEARQLKYEHGIEVFFVDYLQRVRIPGADRYNRVSEVALSLAELAKELEITVIALAQVNRSVDKNVKTDIAATGGPYEAGMLGAMPNLGDFSDSAEIEKEAAIAITLYRPEVHYPEDDRAKGLMIQNVCANRHGQAGFIPTTWLPETQSIIDYRKPVAEIHNFGGNHANSH